MATWRDRGRCAVSRERHRQRAVGAETQASARRPKAFSARMTRPGARPRRTCEPSETSGLAPMRPVGRRFCFGRPPTWKQKRRARRCPRVWRLVVRGSGSTGWSALVPPKTPHFDKPVSGTSACSVAGGDLGGRKPLTSRELCDPENAKTGSRPCGRPQVEGCQTSRSAGARRRPATGVAGTPRVPGSAPRSRRRCPVSRRDPRAKRSLRVPLVWRRSGPLDGRRPRAAFAAPGPRRY